MTAPRLATARTTLATALTVCVLLATAGCSGIQASGAVDVGAPDARPASADVRAVTEAAQRLFDAMAARDTTALRALLHPQARLVSVGPGGEVQASPASGWIAALARSTDTWRERMWSPRVEVDGPLATLWAPYDFRLGEAFSHCGTDAFQFVRAGVGEGAAWRLVAVTYTVQTAGCLPGLVTVPSATGTD